MHRYQIQVITTWLINRIAFVVNIHLILLRVFYRNLTFLLELRSCKACCTYKSAPVSTLNRALQRLHRSILVTDIPGLILGMRPANDRHRYKVSPVFPNNSESLFRAAVATKATRCPIVLSINWRSLWVTWDNWAIKDEDTWQQYRYPLLTHILGNYQGENYEIGLVALLQTDISQICIIIRT